MRFEVDGIHIFVLKIAILGRINSIWREPVYPVEKQFRLKQWNYTGWNAHGLFLQ